MFWINHQNTASILFDNTIDQNLLLISLKKFFRASRRHFFLAMSSTILISDNRCTSTLFVSYHVNVYLSKSGVHHKIFDLKQISFKNEMQLTQWINRKVKSFWQSPRMSSRNSHTSKPRRFWQKVIVVDVSLALATKRSLQKVF